MSRNKLYHEYAIAIGSNMGDRAKMLRRTRILITILAGHITKHSSNYETAPWGEKNQSSFLNQVILIHSHYHPDQLYAILASIELKLGKDKTSKWGPRTIDIDILLAENNIISGDQLTIPHPRMLSRNFVLIPLAEIAEDHIHPVEMRSINDLMLECQDDGKVEKINIRA